MRKIFVILSLLMAVVAGNAQTELYLKGNVVKGNSVLLDYLGDEVWQSEVTLDDSRVFLFSDKYVYFECPSASYRSDNIRINGGTYTVRFSMKDKIFTFSAPTDENRISAFGSSVCNGQGASENKGYAWLYGELLGERYSKQQSEHPFYVSGVSIGGNNTRNLLDRYIDLTRNHSRYVIIGLSMGNEGIHEASNKQQILDQFSTNMKTIIRKVKADGMVPVVMNNYTRGDFTSTDYHYIKEMNLKIHQWNVSSVNTLGAIDNGEGHWADGYMQDNAHPTTNGHREFFYAMPPSLFDAIASGKALAERNTSGGVVLGEGSVIKFRGEETVHPFTVTLRVKGGNEGRLLTYKMTSGTREGTLKVDAGGHVVYTNTTNKTLTSENTISDGDWHLVTLTHYFAQGRTLLYVDSQPAGEIRERINAVADLLVGDNQDAAVSRELSEVFFWRSALSPDEVEAVCKGQMLKSSLEIYVPVFSLSSLANKAMSLNEVEYVQGGSTAVTALAVKSPGSRHIYNLSGQQVDGNWRGIRIQDGKKILRR